jgi:hypothetical protein
MHARLLLGPDRVPMAGVHIYVQERDLAAWCDAAIEYWETVAG